MSKIKIAIIGVGRIGTRHALHANNYGNLVSVCDIDLIKAKTISEKYNCNYYENYKEMIEKEDIDIISVCTPNGLHHEHTIEALNSNIHVLCEKPMSISSKHCEEMIHTAEMNNKRLFVVKQNRFNPPIEALKKTIKSGHLGEIINVQLNCFWNRNNEYYTESDWKGTKSLDGGTLFTQFSHFIDLLYYLNGDVEEAYSFYQNFTHGSIIEFEDNGVAIIKFSNGSIGSINFTISSYGQNMEGSITVFGTKGTVKVGGQYLNELDYQKVEDYIIPYEKSDRPPNEYGKYKGSMSNHDIVYKNVIDVLQNKGTIMTNMLDGLKTVQIIEKIYKNRK